MDEVVPEAYGSVKNQIALLGSECKFEAAFEKSRHLRLFFFSLSPLALLLKQGLEVLLVELIYLDLREIETGVSLGYYHLYCILYVPVIG